ncbi:unnamed protein product, partial [Porites evermanni]
IQRFHRKDLLDIDLEIKMAANRGVLLAKQEAAFEAFRAEFTKEGLTIPEGLIALLKTTKVKANHSPDESRARLYKRLWCILWHGSKKTLGAGAGEWPTYVYPEALKRVVREFIPGDEVDRPDPTHKRVYKVTMADLAAATWPQYKTKKTR